MSEHGCYLRHRTRDSPGIEVSQGLEGVRGSDELVQDANDVGKLGPAGAFLLPTLHHELVNGRRAVHGRGEPEAVVDGFHDLGDTIIGVALVGKPHCYSQGLEGVGVLGGPNTVIKGRAQEMDKHPFLRTHTVLEPSMGQVPRSCDCIGQPYVPHNSASYLCLPPHLGLSPPSAMS